ncbi:peptide-methionine (R)-S-oxide reductase MsrB [Hymenobacter cellulosilyticus]|uniref:peptide-methionine (R)-S-oxide reductase n=1 Tax=Hymenobacter cellulosilyticus TaxID=2932248 RepID=A0A8T9PZ32_9BACT|nr:peptide-methionine (R)-S-oxide reductase MsrB [Hymenobacter cellulosilyticus]UOQ69995.1 peptide-methionine (R)-S-oxide reductase MsrB [Hymenobacter cellulosilyticus]
MLRWIDVLTFAKYGNPEPPRRVEKTEAEWAAELPPARFRVLRQHATEPPYRNAYCRSYEPGEYQCAGCGTPLFDSTTKYHAISGWPSFTQPAARGAIQYHFDESHNMQRVEVRCNVCGGHLGHVFPDGPAPAGLRYCINSESLVRVGEDEIPS